MKGNFIQEIKDKLIMVDCVAYYWGQPQKTLGQGVWWRCNFHGENTPSFRVLNNKFRCYGCGEFGDAFDFIRKNFGILKDIDIAIKLNYDFNLGFNFDKEETKEERNNRIKLAKAKEKEYLKKETLKNFTIKTLIKIKKQLKIFNILISEYGNKPLWWLHTESEVTDLMIYSYIELDRLEYLYSLLNGMAIGAKSYWNDYYGENSTEILRKIYKGKIKIDG